MRDARCLNRSLFGGRALRHMVLLAVCAACGCSGGGGAPQGLPPIEEVRRVEHLAYAIKNPADDYAVSFDVPPGEWEPLLRLLKTGRVDRVRRGPPQTGMALAELRLVTRDDRVVNIAILDMGRRPTLS